MLAAENSDFGVDGTGNVDGSYRLIRLKDRWTVWSGNAQNMARCPCCIDCCLLQLLMLCRLCHQRLSTLLKFIVLQDVPLRLLLVQITLNASLHRRQI